MGSCFGAAWGSSFFWKCVVFKGHVSQHKLYLSVAYAKVAGSIPMESKNWEKGFIQCKSLWIKVSAKWIHENQKSLSVSINGCLYLPFLILCESLYIHIYTEYIFLYTKHNVQYIWIMTYNKNAWKWTYAPIQCIEQERTKKIVWIGFGHFQASLSLNYPEWPSKTRPEWPA